jgi:hypothetical protein
MGISLAMTGVILTPGGRRANVAAAHLQNLSFVRHDTPTAYFATRAEALAQALIFRSR